MFTIATQFTWLTVSVAELTNRRRNWWMILSVGIFSRVSFWEASIIKDENHSSNTVVLDESHSAHCSFSTADSDCKWYKDLVPDIQCGKARQLLQCSEWIFAFKLYCDLKTGVRGHSRSSKVTPFDSLHMVSYYRSIYFVSKTHRFRDMTTYLSQIAEKTYPTLIWHVPLRWPRANFSTTHTLPETRIMGLSDGVHFTILLSLC